MSTVANKLIAHRKSQKTASSSSPAKQAEEEELNKSKMIADRVPMWDFLDLDKTSNLCLLILLRMVEACTLTWNV